MALIRIDHHPTRRQLNVFGVLWLVFFAAVGGLVLWRTGSRSVAGTLWGLAVIVPAAGWAFPQVMRIVYLSMAYAAFPIGMAVSFGVLLVAYYLVITPTGLVLRLFGHDPMRRRFDRRASSYWVPREPTGEVKRYFRQF
jgi:hypothetical protein